MKGPCEMLVLLLLVGVCQGISPARTDLSSEDSISGLEGKMPALLHNDTFIGHSDAPKILFYSEWSTWSPCSGRCERTRQRRCQQPQKCGSIVLKETDLCPLHGDKRNRRQCQRAQNRRKHRHKAHEFHVVRVAPSAAGSGTTTPKPSAARRVSRRQRWPEVYNPWQRVTDRYQAKPHPHVHPSAYFGWGANQVSTPGQQRESSVIFPGAGVSAGVSAGVAERLTAYENKLYGKWSRWSQCSRSCTTHRRRNCRRKDLCGNTMVKESAYCYVEDSYCQRWIHRKMQQKDKENEAIQEQSFPGPNRASKAKVSSPPQLSRVGRLEAEGAVGAAAECGVAGNGSASRALGNMLRIIGGRPTAKGRWPWQVAVLNRYREAFCGGTLVSTRWVLTAAHCVRKRLYVRIGEHDLSENDGTETELRIDQVIRHPSYDEETVDNDVALLHLPERVETGHHRGIACLPRYRQPPPTDRYCTIIGWGKRVSSDTFGTDVLHEAEVPVVSGDVCRQVYEDYHITSNMFCAGYRRGRMDSCAGDSGGPLLCNEAGRWTIFGITSFGEGCGKHGKYGIYTRLSNYVKWIQKIIKE